MRSLIWAEIKFLLPGWAIVVLASWLVLVATPATENSDYPLMCLGLGCALLAARAFSRAFPQPKKFSTERSSPPPRPSPSGKDFLEKKIRVPDLLNRGKTSNVQHRTSNAEVSEDSRCHSMFGVGCSMFDVALGSWGGRRFRTERWADPQCEFPLLADGYMAGDWHTAKLMISLFWIGTVIVSVLTAATCRHRFKAWLAPATAV